MKIRDVKGDDLAEAIRLCRALMHKDPSNPFYGSIITHAQVHGALTTAQADAVRRQYVQVCAPRVLPNRGRAKAMTRDIGRGKGPALTTFLPKMKPGDLGIE